MVYFGQCLFYGPSEAFFGPQSHPTDSATSLIGHIHLKWTDHGRYCSGLVVHQEMELVHKRGNTLET